MINDTDDIKVSVCVVTYNQEKYIAECLDSLVSQETEFKFEIIVGEDCSTDGTRTIVQQYVDKYPDLVKPIFHKENVGAVENIKQVYIAAKGKYIAHMDGDDMALPDKLQQQFDVLENYISCNICTHDMFNIGSDGKCRKNNWTYPEKEYDLLDLYGRLPFFAHSSKMFRNNYSNGFWYKLLNKPNILDIDVHIANAYDGNIFHIGRLLGKYRSLVGVSYSGGKVNPAFPLAAIRLFDKGLIFFENDDDKLEKLRYFYALSMLSYAYNYAIYDKDINLYNVYTEKSIQQKFIGTKQIIFKLASFCPYISFKLFYLRHKIRSM